MSERALTAFDLESIMQDLYNDIDEAAAHTMIVSKRTFLMLKRANRMWQRRKRVRRLIHRGSLVKLREIELPEIPYQEPPREPLTGLQFFMNCYTPPVM